jgi:hypothetical protein
VGLNYVTLTLDLYDGQGNPEVRGAASFVPSAVLTDAGVEIISQDPVVAVFHAAGLPAVKLLATDNAAPLPSGWTWGITFAGQAAPPAPYSIPLTASPMTFTATNATPCVFTSSGTAYVNGTGVQLSGGSLPAGFSAGVTYYVTATSGSTFELAATAGGSPLPSTSTGSGSVIAVTQFLSNLSPVSSGTAFQAYMPLPSGTPNSGQVPIATGTGEASAWGNVATNPMTTSGDTVYGGSGGTLTRLAGDTTNTRKFLREQSSAGTAQPPAWDTIQAGDVPTLNQNTTGTAANITGTLDQVPSPTANWSNNSHKITSLANGSGAQDAAAFGQLPSSGSPLPLSQGGTGLSESSDAALLAALSAAPLASPALTGVPSAPTASALTNSTQVATTAYADSAVAVETTRAKAAEIPATIIQRILFT